LHVLTAIGLLILHNSQGNKRFRFQIFFAIFFFRLYAPSIHTFADPALSRSRFLPDSQNGVTSRKCTGRPRVFRVPFGTCP